MNARSESQMRLVIVGASGMVGGYALRYMLDHTGVARVTSIGRRKLGISHPKLYEVLHQDFSDCSPLVEAISGQNACVFCLGTYTGTVPDAELRAITVDYTIEFAEVLHDSSPDATFAFLSGARKPSFREPRHPGNGRIASCLREWKFGQGELCECARSKNAYLAGLIR